METETENKRKFPFFKIRKKTVIIFLITFFITVILLAATYAWFSSSLNVKVKFFDLKVSTDTGLFISLDGINFSDSIEVSLDSVIHDLKATYPNHTNQWAVNGLWSVSTNGIPDSNSSKFAVFEGGMRKYTDRARKGQRYLNTYLVDESEPSEASKYVAFDIFLKNASGSPKKDNLYLSPMTYIGFDSTATQETIENMQDILNTLRLGIVKIGETSTKSDVKTIQNLQCNNECMSVIYEPYSLDHNEESVNAVAGFNINIQDHTYVPTYGVIKEGKFLDHKSGFVNSGVNLDTEHFALQHTIFEQDFSEPIFQVPNGITKARVYLWIEGQDVDALEVFSEGAPIYLNLEFDKDLAGYEGY